MSKKFFNWMLLALFVSGVAVNAEPVNKGKAAKAFKGWSRSGKTKMGVNLQNRSIADTQTHFDSEGVALFHAISFDSGGYVVLSADDLIEPVIAFSDKGDFTTDPENPLFALLTADLSVRLKASEDLADIELLAAAPLAEKKEKSNKNKTRWDRLVESGNDVEFATEEASEEGVGSIDDVRVNTLVTTRWNQSSPENYYTPGSGPCGCVATAMAQLMNYHEHTYAVGLHTGTIKVESVSQSATTRGGDGNGGPYVWSAMPNYPGSSDLQVGALCYDAGVSVGMNYKSDTGSSYTERAAAAFTDWFGYASGKKLVVGGTASDEQLQTMVNTNLDALYPVLLGIHGSGGHAVVCDGYGFNSSVPYHHLNMGWGGSSDAWYNLPNIDTGWFTSDYDQVYKIIYNVFPNDGGAIISGRVFGADGYPLSGMVVEGNNGSQTYTATTNSKGIYALEHVPSGTYSVKIVDDELTSETLSVSIGNTTTIDWCPNKWAVNLTVSDAIRTADEDAYVLSSSANSNYGSNLELAAQNVSGGTVYESFIKFDLRGISADVETAQLRLTVDENASDSINEVYVMSDDSWTEGSVTYNNRPTAGTKIAKCTPTFVSASSSGTTSADNILCIDVGSSVVSELAGDNVITFCLRGDNGLVKYCSRESAHPPQLVLSQNAEADSTADWEADSTQPDGAWTYGSYPPGVYTDFELFTVRSTYSPGAQSWIGGNGEIWDSTTGYPRVGKYATAPAGGEEQFESVKRWTSNIKGVITAIVDVQQIQDSSDGNIITVRKNGVDLWSQNLESNYRAVKTLEISVYPGDVLDFAIDPVGNGSADWCYLRARITTQTPTTNRSKLAAHYDFDEAADMPTDADGDIYDRKMYAYDYSGESRYAILRNCDTWTVWQPGTLGNAIQLDGVNDYIETSLNINPSQNHLSVATWVKGGTSGETLFSQSGGQNWLQIDESGHLSTGLKAVSGSALSLVDTWEATSWHHVVLTWDGSKRALYVDGTKVAVDAQRIAPPVAASGLLLIGADSAKSNTFSGMLDDLGVWTRALSSSEIYSMWMSGQDGRNLGYVKSYYTDRRPPMAYPQNVELFGGETIDIVLSGHDDNARPLTYTVQTQPAHGTLSGTGSNLTYTADLTYFGPDFFTYKVANVLLESDSATISIDVEANLDLDDDGLPNDWESQYFATATAADPLGDPDGDHVKNLEEYAFGGNPTNMNVVGTWPYFEMTRRGMGCSYTLRNDPGLKLTIMSCTDLIAGNWITNSVINGVSGDDFTSRVGALPQEDCQFLKWKIEK